MHGCVQCTDVCNERMCAYHRCVQCHVMQQWCFGILCIVHLHWPMSSFIRDSRTTYILFFFAHQCCSIYWSLYCNFQGMDEFSLLLRLKCIFCSCWVFAITHEWTLFRKHSSQIANCRTSWFEPHSLKVSNQLVSDTLIAWKNALYRIADTSYCTGKSFSMQYNVCGKRCFAMISWRSNDYQRNAGWDKTAWSTQTQCSNIYISAHDAREQTGALLMALCWQRIL